jgi:hypothetical protein
MKNGIWRLDFEGMDWDEVPEMEFERIGELTEYCHCDTKTIKRAVDRGALRGPTRIAGNRRRWVFARFDLDQWNEGRKPPEKRTGPGRRPRPVYKHFNFD